VTNPSGKAAELLSLLHKKLGRTPNMMSTLATSPSALEAYVSLSGVLGSGLLKGMDRERLALRSAVLNKCDYCEKAHSAIGKMVGLSESEVLEAKEGKARDPKSQAMLNFSSALIEKRGLISDSDFNSAKSAGLNEAEILEVVANTCLNIYTNYLNHVSDPVIDF